MKISFLFLFSLILSLFSVHAQQQLPLIIDNDTIFSLVDEPPSYDNGDLQLSNFLSDQIDFKKIKTEYCYYALTIGKTGQILLITKLKGSTQNETQLVTALKKSSGHWKHGTQNGHPVSVHLLITLIVDSWSILAITSTEAALPQQTNDVATKYERGKLIDGYKAGVWEYYDTPGDLALKINYTSAELLFLKPDTTAYAIKIKNEWEKQKLDMQPRYIGSMFDFKKVQGVLKYPEKALNNITCGRFYITFEIDTLGQAVNYTVINDIGDNCAESIVDMLKSIPNYWLVAMKDGKKYESRFIIPVTFKMSLDGKEYPAKKRKNYVFILPLANQLDEIVIEIMGVTRERKVRSW